jgi:hypothetical protein
MNVSPPSSERRESTSELLSMVIYHVFQLQVIANIVPSLLVLATFHMEEKYSSETSALTRATRRHIPEDSTPDSHRRKNLKS